ncbi:MAG TPA: hydrogenase expression/formation protein HypE [Candidatus Paceibacterota bacterium]|nr:hydrogenase expression/formation protein HypE [Verrucomicrobiota bacterium]HRY48843.1 hydrogenase expression/formation protein HypE [Candidatus Paceibacterota bacterium]HSA02882.1 hydrogenase expression/formation protein HypE [Candidatus Paceibacterota bacterium]
MQEDVPKLDPQATRCPIPIVGYDRILMAHGGGGRLTHQLLEKVFIPAFGNPLLNARHDGALLDVGGVRLAFSTDSYVIHPLFFPGGDIGSLAVNGTVNDLAMCGARPLYLSAGFILEEGLPIEVLQRIAASMQAAAREAGVQLVTGDTKVVEKGKGDGLFINTAGIGLVDSGREIQPSRVKPGDVIVLSGDIGRHGVAIMAAREGLAFQTTLTSDCAPLAAPVQSLLLSGLDVHCLRDLTRGGLASALVEIAESSQTGMVIDESCIPLDDQVRGACEMLGLDPLYVANEGRFVTLVAPQDASQAVRILQQHSAGRGALIIGRVESGPPGSVVQMNRLGTRRLIERLSGEQLPRIC